MLNPYSSRYNQLSVALHLAQDLSAPGMTVLDLGCGDGSILDELIKSERKAVGFDISWETLNSAKRRLPTSAHLVAGDAGASLPFKNHSFDLICMIGVLGGIPEPAEAALFSELYRLLKPNGSLLLLVSVKAFPYSTVVLDRVATRWSWRHFPPATLQTGLTNAGFSICDQLFMGAGASVLGNYLEYVLSKTFMRWSPAASLARVLMTSVIKAESAEFSTCDRQRGRFLYTIAKRTDRYG